MPLKNYRVLDLSRIWAGPYCTKIFADMGAEIIKIEMAPYGVPSRAFPYRKHKRSAYYVQQNRGKKSLCLNFKDQRSREIVHDLIRTSDVLIENFRPGTLARPRPCFGFLPYHARMTKILRESTSGA